MELNYYSYKINDNLDFSFVAFLKHIYILSVYNLNFFFKDFIGIYLFKNFILLTNIWGLLPFEGLTNGLNCLIY